MGERGDYWWKSAYCDLKDADRISICSLCNSESLSDLQLYYLSY